MNLKDIKKSYDLIVSLGSSCDPAAHLRRYKLRKFSAPLDWVVTLSLSDVSRLLKNKFDGYMELEHMRLIDGTDVFVNNEVVQPVKSYFVKDTNYNVISVHDFPVIPNQDWKITYPEYKEKLNSRINRLFEQIANSESVLFVRWGAKYEEVVELQSVISKLINNHFHILILFPVDGLQQVVEIEWGIDDVCAVKVPNKPSDISIWDDVLNGISINN